MIYYSVMRYESMDDRDTVGIEIELFTNVYIYILFSVQGGYDGTYYVLHKLYLMEKGEQSAKKGGCTVFGTTYTPPSSISRMYFRLLFMMGCWQRFPPPRKMI